MADNESQTRDMGLALLGSVLMFVGWVLAIVPTFHQVKDVILPVVLGIIGFGIVLVPAGLEFFGRSQEAPGEKRGVGVVFVSILPAAILFAIAVAAFPLSALFRILAVAVELIGMVAYGWAIWVYHH